MTQSIIIGTAGHIDHGKTALVNALTGINTDRLKEERLRGITIELGFAYLQIESTLFGIVDVPGHERFIKTMVAGVTGIDLLLLVVAADEGVMPQTREHLDICQLLGIQRGLVALTKSDLVEAEWLTLVKEDLKRALKSSFLEAAPICCCSTKTGEGLDDLRRQLLALSKDYHPRDAGGLLRLPLDRVFTIKGFGTVVTGTLVSGTLRVADEILFLPDGAKAKVRSLQVHGRDVPQAVAGQRTAVNIGSITHRLLEKGEVLVHPRTLAPSSMIDVHVSLLPQARKELSRRSKVLFHLGTRQQEATCILLDRDRLAPGETALAQLHFEHPIVALPHDRFILRGFKKLENYGTTIGGGIILKVLSHRLRPNNQQAIQLLEKISCASTEERVALELLSAGPTGLSLEQLQQRLPLTPSSLKLTLARLIDQEVTMPFDLESGSTVHRQHVDHLRQRLLAILDTFHAKNPLLPGISREELRSRLGWGLEPRLFSTVVEKLAQEGLLRVERELCALATHSLDTAAQALRPLMDRLMTTMTEAGLGPPNENTLAAELQADPRQIAEACKLLVEQGQLIRLGNLLFASSPINRLREQLVAFLRQQGQITPAQFKAMVGQSRKYAIPLAEYFDTQKITLRVGEVRKLRVR